MEHVEWVILAHSTNRTSGPNENLIYVIFCMRQSLVCLYFFSSSFAGSQRAHASGALASFGSIRRRKKNNAEENRRITKNKIN